MMRMIDGGMRMPRVPPAAIEAEASSSLYLKERISGMATLAMVAAVARLEPEMALKPPHATMVAMARPPRRWPRKALEAR
jgi:hypothetical protein